MVGGIGKRPLASLKSGVFWFWAGGNFKVLKNVKVFPNYGWWIVIGVSKQINSWIG